jgi:pyruvate/2-oxoglutarate dehydrogenase complex dihydrolipoamide dehydrogenase (E3) component
MTETEARNSGRKLLVGTGPMTKVGSAVEGGETQGFMQMIADADTKEILGASILGASGDEAIHRVLDVMYAKSPCTVLQRAVSIPESNRRAAWRRSHCPPFWQGLSA